MLTLTTVHSCELSARFSRIRTSLALVAGGLGSIVVLKDIEGVEVIGVMVLALAFVTPQQRFAVGHSTACNAPRTASPCVIPSSDHRDWCCPDRSAAVIFMVIDSQ